MPRGRARSMLLLGMTPLFLGGCLKHENPLDPENELTHGIAFLDSYHAGNVDNIRISDDGYVYTFSYYDAGVPVEKYSAGETGLEWLGSLPQNFTVRDLAFSPNGSGAVLISSNNVTFWDTGSMSVTDTRTLDSVTSLYDACYSTDGERVYVSPGQGRELYVFSASTHDQIDTITGLPAQIFHLYPYQGTLYLFCYDGGLVVTRLTFDGEGTEPESWAVYPRFVRTSEDALAFSPADRRVYFVDSERQVLVHGSLDDPAGMREEPFGDGSEAILDVEIDPRGEFLYVGGHWTVTVYSLPSAQPFLSYRLSDQEGASFMLYGLEATPDGRRVLINSLPTSEIGRMKIRF